MSSVEDFVGSPPGLIDAVFGYGYLGVDFFFVLSGFIIYYTTRERYSPSRFAYRRLTRIFVPYLPIGVGMGALYLLLPQLSGIDREYSWLATLTLLPSNSPPALSVAWTLQHELVFYAIFGMLMATRLLLPGMLVWSAAIVVASTTDLTPAAEIVFGTINLEFGFGVLAAYAVTRQIRPPLVPTLTLAIGLLALFGFTGGEHKASPLVGAAIALLVPYLCHAEKEGRFTVSASWLFLGAASYSIYLLHNPALSVLARVAERIGASPLTALPLLIVFSTLAGVVYHWVYENPALKGCRLLEQKRAPTPRTSYSEP